MKRTAALVLAGLWTCFLFFGQDFTITEFGVSAMKDIHHRSAAPAEYVTKAKAHPFQKGPLTEGSALGKELGAPGSFRCTTILVGPSATPDGSVLLAHNEDLGDSAAQRYFAVPRLVHAPGETISLWSGAAVPQVEETLACSGTKVYDPNQVPGDLTSGVNECRVAVVNNLAYQRDPIIPGPTKGRMLWSEFTRLALERARTAREAVELIGRLAQTYKLADDTGTMFGVTDPAEAWWIEIAQEGQWIARRVPRASFEMRANAFRIGKVNLEDTANVLHSPDVVSYARAKGWYAGDDAAFDFARAYGDPAASAAAWNTRREERVKALLSGVVGRIRVPRLMAVLRDHYEGTPLDLTRGYKLGSPHRTAERAICNANTEVSVVVQSRSWLPPDIGTVAWRAMATPCSSVYVPWYPLQQDIPGEYEKGTNVASADSAYWAFRRLAEYVDADYGRRIGPVTEVWKSFEAEALGNQPALEGGVGLLEFHDPGLARFILTAYTRSWAERVFERARAWIKSADGARVPDRVKE
jgi:dipeptidase